MIIESLVPTPSVPFQRPPCLARTRQPLPDGSTNENPAGVSLFSLVSEDWRTHDSSFIQPGFWAIFVHRLGNARMDLPRILRAPFTVLYHLLYVLVNWMWGIDVGYTVKLGRRVRIWHHGGIVIGARSIGDDVHIRQNTTLGVLSRNDLMAKPTIGDRVDIGAGACILGEVNVGSDAVIGANSVVVKDVQPRATMFGVPARPVKLLRTDS